MRGTGPFPTARKVSRVLPLSATTLRSLSAIGRSVDFDELPSPIEWRSPFGAQPSARTTGSRHLNRRSTARCLRLPSLSLSTWTIPGAIPSTLDHHWKSEGVAHQAHCRDALLQHFAD